MTEFKVDFLFKKTFGASAGTGTSATAAGELAGNSRGKLYKDYIIGQDIPAKVSDLGGYTAVAIDPTIKVNTNDTKYTYNSYTYISKYTLQLQAAIPGYSYYYNDVAAGKNLLSNAIPYNFDPAGSYAYTLTMEGATKDPRGESGGARQWVFDTDCGYIYFPYKDAYGTIVITFWRYEGSFGVNTINGNLNVTGQITAGSFNTFSDYRIKANVVPLSDASYSVDLLRPVTYMNKTIGKQDIGFIAHEVQEQIPFLVTGEKDAEKHQTVNYIGIIGLLTKEIQDLKKENKGLREKIENIELRLSNM